MDPVVYEDGVAGTLAAASVAIVVAREIVLNFRTRRTRGAETDRGSYWLLAAAMFAGVTVAIRAPDWAPGLTISDGGWWPFVVGALLFWSGALLRWWAIHTLGRFFQLTVVVQADQPVIEDGPYRHVRHPSYTGAMLMFLGAGVALDNWLSLAGILLLPALGFVRRIHSEDEVLCAQLGEPYRDYARRTRRLIPGVW